MGELILVLDPFLVLVGSLPPLTQEPIGGDPNNKREREINPSVAMVLEDKDMRSGTLVRKNKRGEQPHGIHRSYTVVPGLCFFQRWHGRGLSIDLTAPTPGAEGNRALKTFKEVKSLLWV